MSWFNYFWHLLIWGAIASLRLINIFPELIQRNNLTCKWFFCLWYFCKWIYWVNLEKYVISTTSIPMIYMSFFPRHQISMLCYLCRDFLCLAKLWRWTAPLMKATFCTCQRSGGMKFNPHQVSHSTEIWL